MYVQIDKLQLRFVIGLIENQIANLADEIVNIRKRTMDMLDLDLPRPAHGQLEAIFLERDITKERKKYYQLQLKYFKKLEEMNALSQEITHTLKGHDNV